MSSESKEISDLVKQKYQHGFVTEIEQELVPPGLVLQSLMIMILLL